MDPAALRAEIPACESCAYLNTGASGPAPRPVVEAVADAQRRHEFDACETDHYDAAADMRSRARERLADHLGCGPDEVALVASTAPATRARPSPVEATSATSSGPQPR